METRNAIIFNGMLALACLCLCVWFWPSIPDNASVVMVYNLQGNALGYAGKTWALLSGPVMVAGITAAFTFFPMISPQFGGRISASPGQASNVLALAGLCFTAEYVLRLMRLTNTDQLHEKGTSFFIFLLASIFFANQMTKRNALMSATEHRFYRFIAWARMVSGAVAVVIFCLMGPAQSFLFFFGVTAIGIAVGTWHKYRNNPRNRI